MLVAVKSSTTARTIGVRATYRSPSRSSWKPRPARTGIARGATRIANSAAMTARLLRASSVKHHPSPTKPTTAAAATGPSILAEFFMRELSATAFGRSARSSIISPRNDCRATVSNALITACTAPSTTRCQTVILPVSAKHASAADCSIAATCVAMTVRWRFHRSTSTPAMGASNAAGACPKKPTRPSMTGDPVRRYTIHTVAKRVSSPPASEMLWPAKNSR